MSGLVFSIGVGTVVVDLICSTTVVVSKISVMTGIDSTVVDSTLSNTGADSVVVVETSTFDSSVVVFISKVVVISFVVVVVVVAVVVEGVVEGVVVEVSKVSTSSTGSSFNSTPDLLVPLFSNGMSSCNGSSSLNNNKS
jgi:hypothetical protein